MPRRAHERWFADPQKTHHMESPLMVTGGNAVSPRFEVSDFLRVGSGGLRVSAPAWAWLGRARGRRKAVASPRGGPPARDATKPAYVRC